MNAKVATGKWKALADYWLAYYVNNGHCGLCGNRGIIDTTGRAVTAAGVQCGSRFLCICPNGQAMRKGGVKP